MNDDQRHLLEGLARSWRLGPQSKAAVKAALAELDHQPAPPAGHTAHAIPIRRCCDCPHLPRYTLRCELDNR